MNEEIDVLEALIELEKKMKKGRHSHMDRPKGMRFFGPGPQVPPEHMKEEGPRRGGMMLGRRRALITINEHPGLTSTELSEALDIRPSSTTELVAKLENDGMITKEKDEKDSRVIHIYLSDKAKEVIEALTKHKEEMHENFANTLTEDEKKTFVSLCRKIQEGL